MARILPGVAGLLELHDTLVAVRGETREENGVIFYNNETTVQGKIAPWKQTAMGFQPASAGHGRGRTAIPAGHATQQQPADFQ